ncbi:MAG: restriction endonuclease [Candidatus Limnocylindrales bacterium]
MAVPDFQTIMLPLLRLGADGKDHAMASTIIALSEYFQLTDDERAEMLPGGCQRRFNNRVYWAKTHLRAAGLVASPTRGRFRVTEAGRAVLASPPAKIEMHFLSRYPGYAAFKGGVQADAGSPATAPPATPQTPDEVIATAAKQIRDELAHEVLARVSTASYDFLEMLVVRLLRGMGYGGPDEDAGVVVGGSGDEGVDGVIKQDRLGKRSTMTSSTVRPDRDAIAPIRPL